ncbi:DUF2798 domain-containing protein [Aliivibrio kagoshimensis]|uniref:DUF2798 domain-containing protein n=1 Tax=Aliivibrio kagoshimensis TaxID=2910230 RepID=UPI003D0E15C3
MNRKQFWISTLLGSAVMSFCMSGLISAIVGGVDHFSLDNWMHSYLIAWPIALAVSATIIPQIRKLSFWLAAIGSEK